MDELLSTLPPFVVNAFSAAVGSAVVAAYFAHLLKRSNYLYEARFAVLRKVYALLAMTHDALQLNVNGIFVLTTEQRLEQLSQSATALRTYVVKNRLFLNTYVALSIDEFIDYAGRIHHDIRRNPADATDFSDANMKAWEERIEPMFKKAAVAMDDIAQLIRDELKISN
jgi:hypothetical protein